MEKAQPERTEGEFHPDNPPSRLPYCADCGGWHEPSGARLDCIRYWKSFALAQSELVSWARVLLCSATPNDKLLGESKSKDWCEAFGKWFAESHAKESKRIPAIILCMFLEEARYRSIQHRHTGFWRAVDESEHRFCDADTVEQLAYFVVAWPEYCQIYP